MLKERPEERDVNTYKAGYYALINLFLVSTRRVYLSKLSKINLELEVPRVLGELRYAKEFHLGVLPPSRNTSFFLCNLDVSQSARHHISAD